MTDISPLDKKDKYGHSARDYTTLVASLNSEMKTAVDARTRELVHEFLQSIPHTRDYRDLWTMVEAVTDGVMLHLLAEGWVSIAQRGLASPEEIDRTVNEAVARFEKHAGGRQPAPRVLDPGGYV